MARRPDPFAIREAGGSIHDRSVEGFSQRRIEGTTLGEPGLGTLRRVISQRVPWLLAGCLTLAVLILGTRLVYLQGVRGRELRRSAEGNRIRLEVVPAQRGEIVDRRGQRLAANTPSFNLVVLPADLPRDETDRQDLLNDLLGDVPTELLDQSALTSLSQLSYLPRVVASGLPRPLALKLILRTTGHKGFLVVAVGEREYYGGASLGHVIGYVGKLSPDEYQAQHGSYQLTDSIGKTNLELTYEAELRGVPGRRQVEVDALGRERKIYAAEAPAPGATLELALDARLQQLAYRLLTASAAGHGGSILALDPRSGEVLALASYPSFDPNLFTVRRSTEALGALFTDEHRPLFNRAVAGQYPPGSTVKPLLALAGLADGTITPQTTVTSTGGVWAGKQFFADWKPGGHGPTNVYRAIAESVNTFFYLLGGGSDDRPGLGISRMVYYLNRFGLGRKTGIDLPGEGAGFIPTPSWKAERLHDHWYRGDTYNVAIGQGNLTVTPLQLAAAYAAVAHGGTTPVPHLVRAIRYPDGHSSTPATPTWREFGLAPGVLRVVQDAMRQTVTSGSARTLGKLLLPVAGKTGTAQTGTGTSHAWFAGYAPAANPELVVVVMIEQGGEGSAVAVPIARELFDWYASHRSEIQPGTP